MENIAQLLEKELDLKEVDQETANLIVTELGEAILERVVAALLARDESGEMQKLAEEGKLAEAFAYAEEHFPYIGEILEAAASEVILEYKSAA